MKHAALGGLRVLELGHHISAPYCGKLLAELGADVIKIEPPSGDPLREWGPFPNDVRDPEASGLFRYLNANKRGAVLDLAVPRDTERAGELAAGADLVIENFRPGVMERFGLSFDRLRALNPHIALIRISGFGQSGPYRDFAAPDLIVQAAGGWIGPHGIPKASPVRVGGRLPEFLAGSFAAAATLSAVAAARSTGEAVQVDVSLMECLVGTLPYPMRHRAALEALELPAPLARHTPLPGILRCSDGWVGINALTHAQWEMACIMLDAPEFADRMDEVSRGEEAFDAFSAAIRPWLMNHRAHDVLAEGQRLRIPSAPVGNGRSLCESPQLGARDFFTRDPDTDFVRPGAAYRLSKTPVTLRSGAPSLAEGRDAAASIGWRSREGDPLGIAVVKAKNATGPPDRGDTRPLAGLRVLDLGTFWAGPYAGMYLASLGADVIKIESIQRPDGFRFIATSTAAGERWYETGPLFQATNLGKRDVTLDLSREEGRALLDRLIETSDVLIENFAPRVMERWGYDYERVSALRPDIVMVRLPGFGLEGPWRDYVGWALVIEQAAGMSWLVGEPDVDPPRNPGGFFDCAVGMHTAFAVQAALAHRRRCGEGQLIEVAQFELGVCLSAEQVMDFALNGRVQQRSGNRARDLAPQGVYPCLEDEWIALCARNDGEWSALVAALGDPDWARARDLASSEGRLARATEIDPLIADWTRHLRAKDAAETLRRAGVPAARVLRTPDMYGEDQLEARDYYQTIDHPVSGARRYPVWPMRFSFMQGAVYPGSAPTLGQHNEEVLCGELGLSPDAVADLRARGIIGNELPR